MGLALYEALVESAPEKIHGFTETDAPNFSFRDPPCSFYSGTKALGEEVVGSLTPGQALVGTYYAYLTAHGINQQDSGHLAARRVFDSPDVDFLMSPPNYWYRKPGEASTFMSATDSLRLRGKLWLDESDHRTHLTDPGAGYGRANTLHETLGVYWREVAEVMAAAPRAELVVSKRGAESVEGHYHQGWRYHAVGTGEKISLGQPTVKGASVAIEILEHLRGPKLRIFKFKRRREYRRRRGHRDELTRLRVTGIQA